MRCEPKEPHKTGDYKLGVRIGVYNSSSEDYSMYYQVFVLNVYREIFENANIALFVGLTIGI